MNDFLNQFKKMLRNYNTNGYSIKKYLDYTVLFFSILLGFHLRWNMENIAMFAFLIWIILNPVSSQLLVKAALVFLFFVPFLLIINREMQSEQLAAFSYYFLFFAIISAAIEIREDNNINTIEKKNEKLVIEK